MTLAEVLETKPVLAGLQMQEVSEGCSAAAPDAHQSSVEALAEAKPPGH